ncbi:MAG: hypothetical protein KBS60_05650 [Phascolarctobacterium sp.]|nr:hypothetical protein [Candidatus Phascolarctobacterium caballi]
MEYIQGDILELKDGRIATVVQVQDDICVCLDGLYPPKDLSPTEWQFCNVRGSAIKNKVGNLNNKNSVDVALKKYSVYLESK